MVVPFYAFCLSRRLATHSPYFHDFPLLKQNVVLVLGCFHVFYEVTHEGSQSL